MLKITNLFPQPTPVRTSTRSARGSSRMQEKDTTSSQESKSSDQPAKVNADESGQDIETIESIQNFIQQDKDDGEKEKSKL